MFKRFTQCPHFPQRVKHIAFLIANAGLFWATHETGILYSFRNVNEFMLYLIIPFLIYFFLWKYNYFTRNKYQ